MVLALWTIARALFFIIRFTVFAVFVVCSMILPSMQHQEVDCILCSLYLCPGFNPEEQLDPEQGIEEQDGDEELQNEQTPE